MKFESMNSVAKVLTHEEMNCVNGGNRKEVTGANGTLSSDTKYYVDVIDDGHVIGERYIGGTFKQD